MKYIKEVRELLRDPKKKSLTLLGIYFIFFIFVYVVLNASSTSTPTPVIEEEEKEVLNTLENYKLMESYNYKITYTGLNKIDIMEGIYYKGNSLFSYNNMKYYLEDFIYIIDNNTYYLANLEYDITKVFNNNLYNILNSASEGLKTSYEGNIEEVNYYIDSNIMYKYLYNIDINTYTNTVGIIVTKKDNIITNITLDLTNLNTNITKIDIEYSNINKIENLEFNKENYTYKENV